MHFQSRNRLEALRMQRALPCVINLTLCENEWSYNILVNYSLETSYPPVSLVAPLFPVALGCLCCLQLPLALSLQEAQWLPCPPEILVKQMVFKV